QVFAFQTFQEAQLGRADRMRSMGACNLALLDGLELCGEWDMPMLEPCDVVPDDLIGFNYALTRSSDGLVDAGVHFFLEDYQFERVWREPARYGRMLAPFRCTLTPDFSLYRDMPIVQQAYNVYRSRLVGAHWQRHGISVIPTLQWSTPESYSFAFDGLPAHSVVAASTIGAITDRTASLLWRHGMRAALERLEPSLVLLYGRPMPGFDWRGTPLIRYDNHVTERMKTWEAGARRAA
ncbi:DUF4417 domain-containing protein, partial [Bifidobacterium jacchi]|uniref:DUF4417 domain-containing protein n=1 Tax=Bifidobacterium jacchi TaxID=2490545 RepID=UPI0019D6ABB4